MNMKNIFKSILVLSATVLVASCNVENVGTKFSDNNIDNAVSFVQSVVADQTIPAGASSYDIMIARNTKGEAQTVKLKSTLPEGMCPATVTIPADAYEAPISLDMSSVKVGVLIKGKISIEDQPVYARTDVSVTVAKAYDWVSLGKGEFLEYFWEGFVAEVEILKAEGFDVYRVLKPYAESKEAANAGPDYIQFEVTDKANGVVHFVTWTTPYDYDGGKHWVKAYLPSENPSKPADYAKYDDYSVIDGYFVALLPYWYIDGLGGWNVQYGYTIGIALPGAPKSIVDWFKEHDLW